MPLKNIITLIVMSLLLSACAAKQKAAHEKKFIEVNGSLTVADILIRISFEKLLFPKAQHNYSQVLSKIRSENQRIIEKNEHLIKVRLKTSNPKFFGNKKYCEFSYFFDAETSLFINGPVLDSSCEVTLDN